MPTFVAALFSAPLLALVCMSIWRRRLQLSLADAILFGIALYFGAYTLIDLVLNDVRWLSATTVTAVFSQICIASLVLYWFSRNGPRWVRGGTSLQALHADLLSSSTVVVVGVVLLGLGFRYISADIVGELEVQNSAFVADREAELPYWFKSLSALLPMAVFTAGLAAAAKALERRSGRLWWWLWTAGSLAFFFGAGRRALFAMLLIVLWMYLRKQRSTVVMWLAILVAVPALLLFSNVFQAYREVAYRGVVVTQQVDVLGLLGSALNFDLTVSNLQRRDAIWAFNAAVIEADTPGRSYHWGSLFFNSLGNHVPAALSEAKTIFDAELEMQRSFGLPEIDKASNIFVLTYADAGLLSFILAPALLVLFVVGVALVLRHLQNRLLRALLLSSAFYYALNVEVSYTQPVQIARDFLIIASIYWLAATIFKAFRLRRGARPASGTR